MDSLKDYGLIQGNYYTILGSYSDYGNKTLIPDNTYLGKFYKIMYGPVSGGDNDVYFYFKISKTKEFELEDYYIEKHEIKFKKVDSK